ncbi:Histidine triad motif protein [Moelleriella libera RCEF 2490]|uniref:Histidine triad motif protein n=1 Tax=Moelleriella libera RCEF 2490 TaxID=1081109 RepID=A0A168EJV5_9HYPO|nr:Histidine triad motif protein [Moelleriella libera RCEF 2490]
MAAFDTSAAPLGRCPFCIIPLAHTVYDPRQPPPTVDSTLTTPPSYVVLSTPLLIAFLDIMPLSPGHLLLCPRAHRPKLTDASRAESLQLGNYVRVLSAAVARATGVEDWNVVQNNGAAAAQVVPHMHYHIIPRPEIRASGRMNESFTMFGKGHREELDEDEAAALAERIRAEVACVLRDEEQIKL